MNKTFKVAISESHIGMRECLTHILSKWGYQIILIVSNGQELINEISLDRPPDICILDINWPSLIELETCKILKEQWPVIQIVVFTMNVIPSLIQKLNGIADAVISKADGILEIKVVLEQLKISKVDVSSAKV